MEKVQPLNDATRAVNRKLCQEHEAGAITYVLRVEVHCHL